MWQQYDQEILLSLLGGILLLVAWLVLMLKSYRQRLDKFWKALDESVLEQQYELETVQKLILDAVIKGQASTQDSLHNGISSLREKQVLSHTALQRQLLEDAAELKLGLLGRLDNLSSSLGNRLNDGQLAQQRQLADVRTAVDNALAQQRQSFEQRQAEALQSQHEMLTAGMQHLGTQLREALGESSGSLLRQIGALTETTDKRLLEISGQVDKRLADGFEKTTETFSKVLEHLSRIDEAQKKITELSANVVSLQEVLTDKRTRGAFGEVQLSGLIRNLMPEGSFTLQQQLSNGTRVDCMLRLPEPTGNVPIDAKFPLESYQRMMDESAADSDRQLAVRQFRLDIKKHIKDISEKYLIPNETADGAVMFLPAEAIFAEIHAHFPDLVEKAQRRRVWLVSPTTLMAVITTARAVMKDIETNKQVHIIQEHLRYLAADFDRFQQRMDNLEVHIRQAHEDVSKVNVSARKISGRFEKIERVELDELDEQDGKAFGSESN